MVRTYGVARGQIGGGFQNIQPKQTHRIALAPLARANGSLGVRVLTLVLVSHGFFSDPVGFESPTAT